jgi:ribosomal RNA-processing protein 7
VILAECEAKPKKVSFQKSSIDRSPTTTAAMPPTKEKLSIPSKIQDFTILPLRLSPQPSYPNKNATHYLYLRRDAPRAGEEQNPETKRSLFVANLPIDASEGNIRRLFKELCSARVDAVEFDEDTRRAGLVPGAEMIVQGTLVSVPVEMARGKKRKRGAGNVGAEQEAIRKQMEEMALPQIWDRRVWKSGSSGVVIFVDEVARDSALKECARAHKKGKVVEWAAAVEGEELGSKRESHFASRTYNPHSKE